MACAYTRVCVACRSKGGWEGARDRGGEQERERERERERESKLQTTSLSKLMFCTFSLKVALYLAVPAFHPRLKLIFVV